MDDTRLAACPRCGRPLSADAPGGLCPACMLGAGLGDETRREVSDAETMLSPAGAPGPVPAVRPLLTDGQTFGPYRIGRQLGRGGMGEVYGAEHLDSGRRLALKVLRGRLTLAEDRARFLREGQLAASISHPHAVYIFGSEEIDGTPVITMELLPGGTLKDRVEQEGPLPVPDAVAAVLDILGGLDAAQAAGILHRDIKPSNCFADEDGTIKVGDFGLSISTLARDVRAAVGPQLFQGTPQFAPPEQLRGEPLDVRADIYAVGATLYYLLTGRPPFEADDLRDLFRRVTSDPAPSPRAHRPDLPKGLAAIVLQCLEKDPAARPPTHAALAEALRPWSFSTHVPARPGLRAVAGLVDLLIVSVPGSFTQGWTVTLAGEGLQTSGSIDVTTAIVAMAYYLTLEGLWGASLGKRLFGLRVAGAAGPAPFRAIALRTAVFSIAHLFIVSAVGVFGGEQVARFLAEHPVAALLISFGSLATTAAMFVTMRRSNGYAAVHDLVSGTRVVRPRQALRRAAATKVAAGDDTGRTRDGRLRCGPFDVVGDLGGDAGGRLLDGFDATLRRRVWIRALPAGTPRVPDARRDAGRVGRLRWLAGRRAPDENWDAFEAPDGAPLTTRALAAPGWPAVKGWLLDLARELAASERDGIVPPLGLDRVWIRADGHAVLLDFPPPGARGADDADLSPIGLLSAVADRALGGSRPAGAPAFDPRLPLSARQLLDRWARLARSNQDVPVAAALEALAAVVESPDEVSRWRRALPIAMAALPVVVLTIGSLAAVRLLDRATTAEMWEVYTLLDAVEEPAPAGADAATLAERLAIERYLAGARRDVLADEAFWSSPVAEGNLSRLRAIASRVLADHPSVAARDLEQARARIAPRLDATRTEYDTVKAPELAAARAFLGAALASVGLGVGLIGGLLSAIVVPGGAILRMLGFAVVTREGAEIGRVRSAVRALVAWSPALAWFAWLGPSPIDAALSAPMSPVLMCAAAVAVLGLGAAWTLARPERGPVGLITGTRVVVR